MATTYNSNFLNLMNGYTGISTNGGGGGEPDPTPKAILPPSNYKPSGPEQRQNWNRFLDFLKERGMAGNPELDKEDASLGMKLLEEYNKANPDSKVDAGFIPIAQYESYLIRKKGEFPGLTKEEAEYVFGNLKNQYKDRQISNVDSWLGSLTSTQYYPSYQRGASVNRADGTNVPAAQYDFGVNFEDFARSLTNPSIAERYVVK